MNLEKYKIPSDIGDIQKIYILDMFSILDKKVIYKCQNGYITQYVKTYNNKFKCALKYSKKVNLENECPRIYKLNKNIYFDEINMDDSAIYITLSDGSRYELEIERDTLLPKNKILTSCQWVNLNTNQKTKSLKKKDSENQIIMLIDKNNLFKSYVFKEHSDFLDSEINKGQIKSPLREYLYLKVKNNEIAYTYRNENYFKNRKINLKSLRKDIFNLSIEDLSNRCIGYEFVFTKIIS